MKNNTYKFIHILTLLFSVYMVCLGLFVDFHPKWYMSLWEKLIIYATPMVVLFLDMKLNMRRITDEEEKCRLQHKTLHRIFVIYVISLATLLFLGSTFRRGIWDRNIWQVEPFSKDHITYYCNLDILKSTKMYYRAAVHHTMSLKIIILNLVGNLIAFAPFGFFLPVLFKKKIKNVFIFTIVIVLSSGLGEFVQFITMVGQADIDDVILNVLGALIIYSIVHIPVMRKGIRKMLPYGEF